MKLSVNAGQPGAEHKLLAYRGVTTGDFVINSLHANCALPSCLTPRTIFLNSCQEHHPGASSSRTGHHSCLFQIVGTPGFRAYHKETYISKLTWSWLLNSRTSILRGVQRLGFIQLGSELLLPAEKLKTLPYLHLQEARFHQPRHPEQEVKGTLPQEVQFLSTPTLPKLPNPFPFPHKHPYHHAWNQQKYKDIQT